MTQLSTAVWFFVKEHVKQTKKVISPQIWVNNLVKVMLFIQWSSPCRISHSMHIMHLNRLLKRWQLRNALISFHGFYRMSFQKCLYDTWQCGMSPPMKEHSSRASTLRTVAQSSNLSFYGYPAQHWKDKQPKY